MRLPIIISTVIMAAVTAASSYSADIVPFTYNVNQEIPGGYGYGRTDTYDVCIHLQNETLEGAKILGFRVPLPEGGEISPEGYGWVVESLPDNDISAANALAFSKLKLTEDAEGRNLSVEFTSIMELPVEGFYVGYTITVTSVENNSRKFPVATVPGITEGSLIMRTTTHTYWDNAYSRLESMSPMIVDLGNNIPSPAAAAVLPEKFVVAADQTGTFSFPIVNEGISEITSIEYSYKQEGSSLKTGSKVFSLAIPAIFGAYGSLELELSGNSTPGNSGLTFEILKVNETDNMAENRVSTSVVRTLPEIPVNRPLVEEYSGLWCGQCPAGWVALEQGRDLYGEDFVAISYHVGDAMQANIRTPQPSNAVPAVYINRGSLVGSDQTVARWKELSEVLTDCDISVDLKWDSPERNVLTADVSTIFMENHPAAGYKLALALVADGLKNASWSQTNYYSGQNLQGKFWDLFTKDGGKVYGLTFNDIACIFEQPGGIENSLPADIEEFKANRFSGSFKMADAYSSSGYNLASNKDMLRVIAIVLDSKGKVVNSISSTYSSEAAVGSGVDTLLRDDDLQDDAALIETRYYGLDGIELPNPVEALPLQGSPAIRIDRYSDGSIKAQKVLHLHP